MLASVNAANARHTAATSDSGCDLWGSEAAAPCDRITATLHRPVTTHRQLIEWLFTCWGSMRYQRSIMDGEHDSGEFSGKSCEGEGRSRNAEEDTTITRERTGSDLHKLDFTLRVRNPTTVQIEGEGPITFYDIFLESKEQCFRVERSKARRRYSDFEWLRKRLYSTDKFRSPQELPPKRFFGRRDSTQIQERMMGLEQWLIEILSDPFYVSDIALHLFVQTEWSLDQIKAYLDGSIPESQVEELWLNNGKMYSFQAWNPLHQSFEPDEPKLIEYTPDERLHGGPISVDQDILYPDGSDFLGGASARRQEDTPDSGYIPSDDNVRAPTTKEEVQTVAEVHERKEEVWTESCAAAGASFADDDEVTRVGPCGSINADSDAENLSD